MKIPKLNNKKNIDIVVKMLQENYITPKSNINIVKMIFEMLIAVSETNYIAFVECTHCPLILG